MLEQLHGGFYTLLIDKNGYCPTHNTRYSRQPTGDLDHDTRHVRNKRIFDDPVSLGAAGNEAGLLCQTYMRDTGDLVPSVSIPFEFGQRRRGGVRIGLAYHRFYKISNTSQRATSANFSFL